jgi:hypothetical protein
MVALLDLEMCRSRSIVACSAREFVDVRRAALPHAKPRRRRHLGTYARELFFYFSLALIHI